jgi:hypothetical protein
MATDGTIVAINVPPSLHLAALWHPDRKRGIEYLYRTDHGKQWMNPDEVERHLMNGSRAMQIRLTHVLEVANLTLPVALTPPLKGYYSGVISIEGVYTADGDVYINRACCTDRDFGQRGWLASFHSIQPVPGWGYTQGGGSTA